MELSKLEIQLIGAGPREALLGPTLGALEEEPLLRPTHWGISTGIRDPYDRDALLEVATTQPDAAPAILRTQKPGSYASVCYHADGKGTSFDLTTRGPLGCEEAAAFCTAISGVAGKIPLEFGSIDLLFQDQDMSTRMARGSYGHHLSTYLQIGPDLLFARNYFGARLVKLMGGEHVLMSSGFPVRRLLNGAMQFDLVAEPWTADPATLKHAQTRAYDILFKTGIFAHRGPNGRLISGPQWSYAG